MWRPPKTHCRFNLLGKASAGPNLLKPNAAIREWLTVSKSGMRTQRSVRQANYPLIVVKAKQDTESPCLVRKSILAKECSIWLLMERQSVRVAAPLARDSRVLRGKSIAPIATTKFGANVHNPIKYSSQ